MRIFSGKTSPPKFEVEKDGIKLSVCIASIKVLAFNVVDLAAFAILLGAVLLPITILRLKNFRTAQWLLLRIFVQKVFETNLNFRYQQVKDPKK